MALDLSKLPPITFDSIDVSTLLSSIRRTQDEINVLKECISSQNVVCDGLKESVSGVTTRLHTVERAQDTVLKEGVTVSLQNAVCDGLKESVHVSGVTTRLQTVSRAQDTVLKDGVTVNSQSDQDQTMIKNMTEHTDEATQVKTCVNRQKRSYTEALQHGTGRPTDTTTGGDEQGWKQVGRGDRVRAGRDNSRPSQGPDGTEEKHWYSHN